MYCTKCGSELAQGHRFCSECGEENINNLGTVLDDNLILETVEDDSSQMKWYKFLIYFYLIAAAVVNFISISTTAYRTMVVYGDVVNTSNVFAYVTPFAYAVLCIITRYKLAKYKKDGPAFLYSIFVFEILSQIRFFIMTATGKTGYGVGTPIATIIIYIILLWANVVYFKKRAHMFVN